MGGGTQGAKAADPNEELQGFFRTRKQSAAYIGNVAIELGDTGRGEETYSTRLVVGGLLHYGQAQGDHVA